MFKIKYDGRELLCKPDETLLDMFLRNGVDVPFSCKDGICHTCMMRLLSGAVDSESQRGLNDNAVGNDYFLPCRCRPVSDMTIVSPADVNAFNSAKVIEKEMITEKVCRILLEPTNQVEYRTGQFINVKGSEGEIRSYSMAGVPELDPYMELHVRPVRGGKVSQWLVNEINPGDFLEIQNPRGDMVYQEGAGDRDMLMLATSTGLGPLLGIIRYALCSGHKGRIVLYHGAVDQDLLYAGETLSELAEQYDNFSFAQVLSGANATKGNIVEKAGEICGELNQPLVYLCGNPDMVTFAEQSLTGKGITAESIYKDAFVVAGTTQSMEFIEEGPYHPEPDPEMWEALENGKLLSDILLDFYQRVFKDDKLASFFENTTIMRAVGQQYSFLRQIFTGEKVYFGERPRNAHHWMVISHELFDYREQKLVECMKRFGLPQKYIDRWVAMEERFRGHIVKSRPWQKIVEGYAFPLDGYEELELGIGSICDGCQAYLKEKSVVKYHKRLGTIYCEKCRSNEFDELSTGTE